MHLKTENMISIKLDINKVLRNVINKKNQYTIPIFIPHEGCKNECVFCNQRKISGKTTSATKEDVHNTIEEYLTYFKDKGKDIEIAFFGGSFTGIDIKKQEEFLKIANEYVRLKKVSGIRLSTRPDYISPKILKMLKKYNVKTIELGIQSMDSRVLNISKRGHDILSVIRASRLIRLYGFNLGHQIMVGLPGSDKGKELLSLKKVISLKPQELRIYPVYVIKPSKLYDMYMEGSYIPLTVKEAVDRVYYIMKELQNTNIRVIRLGLQSTDEITVGNAELIGPVCDNFAEYVFAKMTRDEIENKLKEKRTNIDKYGCILKVITNKKYTSVIIGPNRINKQYFKEKYNVEMVLEDKGE